MKNYGKLIEIIIRTYNEYSTLQTKQNYYGTDEPISLAQIQVIETILKNKDNYMTYISKELGITKGTLTKSINKLESKGIVERYKLPTNKKEIYIKVTEKGEKIYNQYLEFTYEALFRYLIEAFDRLDPNSLEIVHNMFLKADEFIDTVNKFNSPENKMTRPH